MAQGGDPDIPWGEQAAGEAGNEPFPLQSPHSWARAASARRPLRGGFAPGGNQWGGDLKSDAEGGYGKGRGKRQEQTSFQWEPRRSSLASTRAVNSPQIFLWIFLQLFPNTTISNSSLSSTCAQDALCVPGCKSLSGVSVHATETRKSWSSSSNITSEPDSLCPRSCSPPESFGSFQRCRKPALWLEEGGLEETFQLHCRLFLQSWVRGQVQLCNPAS